VQLFGRAGTFNFNAGFVSGAGTASFSEKSEFKQFHAGERRTKQRTAGTETIGNGDDGGP